MAKRKKNAPHGADLGANLADEMRLAGAELKLPVHYLWYNILRTLGWDITDDVDEPARFSPSFFVAAAGGRRVPVVCEVYCYIPHDTSDKFAQEAFREIEARYPSGALLLFNATPYLEVAGHTYTFGGCLFSGGTWTNFAINEHVHSFDVVLEQISTGFTLGDDEPKWADTNARLAAAATLMSNEVAPHEKPEMISMQTGDWRILVV